MFKQGLSEHQYLRQFNTKMTSFGNQEQGVRILYSPFSCIMCVHLFNMQPYQPLAASRPSSDVTELLQPTFLKRDLERLRSQRDPQQFHVSNGLVIRQMPHTKRVNFIADTEDVVEYLKRPRKTHISIEDQFKS